MIETPTPQAETFALLKQLSVAVRQLFAPFCEVVIHDFSDLEHSIAHIEGDLTGRSVGGAATNLLLAAARTGETDSDLLNYFSTLPNGRTLKSSTIFLRDCEGRAYGAFCINVDVTAFEQFRRLLNEFTTGEHEVSEVFSDDIQRTIQTVIAETMSDHERPILTREEKVDLIGRLDAKGVFQVKKAVPILADQLGLSRATVYNYLGEARGNQQPNGNGDERE
jgi:predicted transcriptional regulator YheO